MDEVYLSSDRPDGAGTQMQTPAEIQQRWRYLRDLLRNQLARFEGGTLYVRSNAVDVSASAIATLKREVAEFDRLILAGSANVAVVL
ncbi:hypothetical protein CA606_11750 [Caulobacter vibrioides]|uniref:Uncharacterized protein n=1 Tax=Caulobacter vibrioides TaxID=155892 RepID=A0A290MVE4_CAUVI|nr:hypothetical protein [Caulobacter vibrioides]ATC32948.1 hypothetical protein CA606_11750 [Caulobacter vibrioides]